MLATNHHLLLFCTRDQEGTRFDLDQQDSNKGGFLWLKKIQKKQFTWTIVNFHFTLKISENI